MQSIQLSKEQESKLLEMCKVLFPEYTTIPNDKNPKFLTISWFTKQGYFIHLMDDDLKENRMIHWFEFCMTYLVNKIYYPDNQGKRNTRSKVEYFFFQSFIDSIEGGTAGYDHPVDYLYKEFKKLK